LTCIEDLQKATASALSNGISTSGINPGFEFFGAIRQSNNQNKKAAGKGLLLTIVLR
jgi:hypothetical protein